MKSEFNVATGTLYHHLRLLKGFIAQNDLKQYELTKEGKIALDFLFREGKESIGEQNSKKILKKSSNTQFPISKKEKYPITVYHNLFSFPSYIYNSIIGLFLILSTIIVMLKPHITFFHFIPMNITEDWGGILPLIWIGISMILFFSIYFFNQSKPNFPTTSLFFLYFNFFLLTILLLNLFPFLQFQEFFQFISLIFQGFYIISWVFLLSYDCWTWERSLLSVLIQNYGLFIVFLFLK